MFFYFNIVKNRYDEDGIEIPEDELEDPCKNDYEQTFIFCVCWAFGSFLEDSGRIKLETFLKENTCLNLPDLGEEQSLYEYRVCCYCLRQAQLEIIQTGGALAYNLYVIFIISRALHYVALNRKLETFVILFWKRQPLTSNNKNPNFL